MKVLAAVCLVIGSVSALGSGPYLPSGWRPDGPAFVLPARPPVVIPPQDIILHGSEASGSDFLREYGPPKLQNLPEVATEQAFVLLEAKFSDEEKVEDNAEVVEAATEGVTDLKYELVEDKSSVTDAVEQATEVIQTLPEQITFEGRSNLEIEASLAEEVETTQAEKESQQIVEETVVKTDEDNSSVNVEAKAEIQEEKTVDVEVKEVEQEVKTVQEEVSTVQEEVKTFEAAVKTIEEDVKNIAEAIVSLEKEVVAQELQISQDLTQVKSAELTSGLEQVPEGFLEYGPPGFREYGPPNQDIIPRSSNDIQIENEKIENNETRRRRFSPKFKSTNSKKH